MNVVKLIFGAFLSLLLLAGCQGRNKNGSPSPFQPVDTPISSGEGSLPPTPGETPSPGLGAPGKLWINSGETMTSMDQVRLNLERDSALKMKISENTNCQGGTWESYATQKSWNLSTKNQAVHISAEFLLDGDKSTACTRATILHDNKSPEIQFNLDPQNSYLTGSSTRLGFQIADLGSGLKSIECQLTGSPVPCFVDLATGAGEASFVNSAVGNFIFQIKALDQLQNASSSQVTWSVQQGTRKVDQSLTIKSQNKVDILVAIDNSASMAEEQQSMNKRMSSLIQQLSGLDWQIGVVTTDPRDITRGDGRLVELTGRPGQYILSSEKDSAEAQKILGATLQRPEVGSSSEQGIYATYRAIERSLLVDSPNRNLFRSDSAFATILISDEDESATGPKNIAANLLSLIRSNWQSQKNFVFHSIIVKPDDSVCLKQQQSVYGKKYAELSKMTGQGSVGGAIIGSVCEPDYASQLSGIGKSIQQLQQTITLDCEPLDSKIKIEFNGKDYFEKFEKNGSKLFFEKNLEAGTYTLHYVCAS